MSTNASRVRQQSTGRRARPFAGATESSDEHRQSLIGALAAVKLYPEEAAAGHTAEFQPFSWTMEQEGELGRFDSQQFLELVKYGSKSEDSVKIANKYLEYFKTTIKAQGSDLSIEVNRQKARLSSRETEFSDYFSTAYWSILRDKATTQTLEKQLNTDACRPCNLLQRRSTGVLVDAAALIERLQKSCRELENQQTSSTVDTDWEEDMHRVKRILDSGRHIGEQKVESIFTGVGNPMFDAQTAEISQLLYDRHSQLAGDLSWGQAVRKQEKAVMRLINTLPWE